MIQQKEAASAMAQFISFGAFFISCPVVLWESGLFAALSDGLACQRVVLSGFSAAAVAAGVAWILWSLNRGLAGMSRVISLGGSSLYAVASCGFGVFWIAGYEPSAALGAVLGMGFAVVTASWSIALSRYGLRSSLVGLGTACGAASLMGLGFSCGLFPAEPIAYLLCVLLGVSAPVVHAICQGVVYPPELLERVETSHLWESLRTMILNPCLGLFLFVFVMSARGFIFADQRYIGAVSVIAASVIVVVLACAWPRFSLSTIYRLFLPAAAALFIVLSSFPINSPSFTGGFLISHGAMAVIALLALASLCAVSHAGEFSPSVVGAALAVVVGAAVLLGVNLRSLALDIDVLGAILLVCAMAYFVYVLLSPLVDYHRLLKECEGAGAAGLDVDPRGAETAAPLVVADRETVCAHLSSEKGLSMREREILPYLARGHRPAYVADVLCISEHTVRTHIRNMYRKLGVGSREELIQLIEGRAEEPSA